MYKQSKRPKRVGWIIFILALAALYFFEQESFWGIVAILSFPLLVFAMIKRAAKRSGDYPTSKRKQPWHPSGEPNEQKWAEENDRRILGEDY